jgi:hypothetical protein
MSGTVADDLDRIQQTLQDQGALWPRQELLAAYAQAYRQLIAQAQGVRRFTILHVPPRWSASVTQGWEVPLCGGNTRRVTYLAQQGHTTCTQPWEAAAVEHRASSTPASPWVTQLWELGLSSTPAQVAEFALPLNHERVAALYYDHERLDPVAVKELDQLGTAWWGEPGGEPWLWGLGLEGSRQRQVVVYRLLANIYLDYCLVPRPRGIVRRLEGDRTYTLHPRQPWPPLGTLRRLDSPDRQYWPRSAWEAPLGTQRDWRSSVQALLVWEVIVPDSVPELVEASTPVLLPAELRKYLRWAVLAEAYSRPGEGTNPQLAQLYLARWERGVRLLKSLGTISGRDALMQRQPSGTRHVTRRPRLPDRIEV